MQQADIPLIKKYGGDARVWKYPDSDLILFAKQKINEYYQLGLSPLEVMAATVAFLKEWSPGSDVSSLNDIALKAAIELLEEASV